MNGEYKICIAFDLDDTLFKERDYVRTGRLAVARHFSGLAETDSDDLFQLMESAPDAFDALLALPAIKKAGVGIDDILAVYRSHKPELTLPDDTARALDALGRRDVALAIITDGRSLTQRNKINALGLERYIPADNILISEEVGDDKLSPRPFECLMERQPADRYYMVGDNPVKDFYHPNLLGWTSIMLRDTAGVNVPSQDLSPYDADHRPQIFIDKLTQLPELCLPH